MSRTPHNVAQRMGYENVSMLGSVVKIARHLRDGGQITPAIFQQLQAAYPRIPIEVLGERALAVNAMPREQRMEAFVTEVAGAQAIPEAHALLREYDVHFARESVVDTIDQRLDARPRAAGQTGHKEDPMSVRALLEAQTHQRGPSTYQGARNRVADRIEHIEGVLRGPDEDNKVTLRDTIAAAAEEPLATAAAEALLTDEDQGGIDQQRLNAGYA